MEIMDSELFRWVILPLLIFIARISDVTIGTIRIMFVARGNKFLSPILGFFEVFIWLLAIGQIMKNLDNIFCYLAYSSGFACGNYIGIFIEEKMALGKQFVQVIISRSELRLVSALRRQGFGVTVSSATGSQGDVKILYAIVRRKDLKQVLGTIEHYNPKAFTTITDTRQVHSGIFRKRRSWFFRNVVRPVRLLRKPTVYQRFRSARKGK